MLLLLFSYGLKLYSVKQAEAWNEQSDTVLSADGVFSSII